jgi:hypothetical protein
MLWEVTLACQARKTVTVTPCMYTHECIQRLFPGSLFYRTKKNAVKRKRKGRKTPFKIGKIMKRCGIVWSTEHFQEVIESRLSHKCSNTRKVCHCIPMLTILILSFDPLKISHLFNSPMNYPFFKTHTNLDVDGLFKFK